MSVYKIFLNAAISAGILTLTACSTTIDNTTEKTPAVKICKKTGKKCTGKHNNSGTHDCKKDAKECSKADNKKHDCKKTVKKESAEKICKKTGKKMHRQARKISFA